jgi:hypothetical protein
VVQKFIKEHLLPVLKDVPTEQEALKKAEGKWPEYPREVMKLTERFLVLRPLPKHRPIASWKDLPREVLKGIQPLKKAQVLAGMKKVTGWPAFAEAFTSACKNAGVAHPPPLGASRPADYPKVTRDFIEKDLMPALSQDDWKALKAQEAYWPGYPRKLVELARKYKKHIPGIMLPGPPALWAVARAGG